MNIDVSDCCFVVFDRVRMHTWLLLSMWAKAHSQLSVAIP